MQPNCQNISSRFGETQLHHVQYVLILTDDFFTGSSECSADSKTNMTLIRIQGTQRGEGAPLDASIDPGAPWAKPTDTLQKQNMSPIGTNRDKPRMFLFEVWASELLQGVGRKGIKHAFEDPKQQFVDKPLKKKNLRTLVNMSVVEVDKWSFELEGVHRRCPFSRPQAKSKGSVTTLESRKGLRKGQPADKSCYGCDPHSWPALCAADDKSLACDLYTAFRKEVEDNAEYCATKKELLKSLELKAQPQQEQYIEFVRVSRGTHLGLATENALHAYITGTQFTVKEDVVTHLNIWMDDSRWFRFPTTWDAWAFCFWFWAPIAALITAYVLMFTSSSLSFQLTLENVILLLGAVIAWGAFIIQIGEKWLAERPGTRNGSHFWMLKERAVNAKEWFCELVNSLPHVNQSFFRSKILGCFCIFEKPAALPHTNAEVDRPKQKQWEKSAKIAQILVKWDAIQRKKRDVHGTSELFSNYWVTFLHLAFWDASIQKNMTIHDNSLFDRAGEKGDEAIIVVGPVEVVDLEKMGLMVSTRFIMYPDRTGMYVCEAEWESGSLSCSDKIVNTANMTAWEIARARLETVG